MPKNPCVPNIRGVEAAFAFCDKEGLYPMLLVAAKITPRGMESVLLDVTSCLDDEIIRVGVLASVAEAADSKLRQATT